MLSRYKQVLTYWKAFDKKSDCTSVQKTFENLNMTLHIFQFSLLHLNV